MWGGNIGVSMSVSEATTVNAQFGYSDNTESAATSTSAVYFLLLCCFFLDKLLFLHMRLGWEVSWGRNDIFGAPAQANVHGRFGAWFFF